MREQVSFLVNNLALLGITDEAARSNVTITSRTFTALENHKRASEWILYGLFERLDRGSCRARFRLCFPCTDGLRAKEFRAVGYRWLMELKAPGGLLPRSCVVRRSMLDDCAGERYEDLLLALSTTLYRRQCLASSSSSSSASTTRDPWRESRLLALKPAEQADLLSLHTHNLIHVYRLRKLRRERVRVKKGAVAFHDTLKRYAEQHRQAGPVGRVDSGDAAAAATAASSQARVDDALLRIRRIASHPGWVELFTPASAQIDPFFSALPWETKAQTEPSATIAREEWMARFESTHDMLQRLGERRDQLPPWQTETQADVRDSEESRMTIEPAKLVRRVQFVQPDLSSLKTAVKDSLQQLLQPDFLVASTIPADDIESIRSMTPRKPKPSLLPRLAVHGNLQNLPVTRNELLKTALRNRASSPKKKEQTSLDPLELMQTPRPVAATRQDMSTVKTINRLIDILNQSSGESTPTPNLPQSNSHSMPYRGTNRSLEQSFRLWDMSEPGR